MKALKNEILRFWKDESGQGATEYILILVVVAAIVVGFREKIVDIVKGRAQDVGSKLGEATEKLK